MAAARQAFRLALEEAQMDASTTLFLDDSVRNVTSAREYGIHSVLVRCNCIPLHFPLSGAGGQLPQFVSMTSVSPLLCRVKCVLMGTQTSFYT